MQEPEIWSLSPADETLIQRHRDIITPCRIRLTRTEDPFGRRMAAFCERLSELIEAVTLLREPAEEDPAAIHLSGNMHFQIIPSGKILEAFLLALAGHDYLTSMDFGVNADEIEKRIALPAILKMYVAANCPYCPQALQRALFLAGANAAGVDLWIIDAQQFPEAAKSDQVRSAPTMILDGRYRWTGVFELSEVVDMMADRNPAQLSAETLKKMIADGNAEGVAELMGESGTVIPGFIDIVTDPKWSVRLGAMVAFEYLAETGPGLAREILDILWSRFAEFDDPVKGDILHLFSVLDNPDMMLRLHSLLENTESDAIKQVASEILNSSKGDSV